MPRYSTPGYLMPPPKGAKLRPRDEPEDMLTPLGNAKLIRDLARAKRRPNAPVVDPIEMLAAQKRVAQALRSESD